MKKARILSFLLTLSVILSQSILYAAAAPAQSPSPSASPTATPASDTGADADEQTAAQEEENKFPEPRAKAALLYDLKGGRTIYQNNADGKIYPASTTKIMTALIALEKGNLNDTLTVSDTALADITYLHSKIDLKAGEQMTLEELLTALLVSSANDAANVIAEYISGDIPAFVELMNERAQELGMLNTHFANPHGFHDDNHYTTANDLLLVTREALKNPKFCELVKIKTTKIAATNMSKERTISTTNHLISRYRNTYHYYPYATGVKTGSTDEAGSCLIATAEKNGVSLLSIVMGCENANQNEGAYSFVDTTAMFEYIFNHYKSVAITSTSEIISDSKVYEAKDNTRVALSPSKDINMLLPSDYTADEITKQFSLPDQVNAPIEKGSQLGTVTYSFRGETIATVDLLAANEVKRDGFLHFLHVVGRIVFSPYVLIPVIAIVILLIMNAVSRYKKRKVRRRKMKSQRPQQRGASYRTGYGGKSYSANRASGRRSSGSRTSSGNRSPNGSRRTGGSSASQRSNYRSSSGRTSSGKPRNPRTPDPWDKYR